MRSYILPGAQAADLSGPPPVETAVPPTWAWPIVPNLSDWMPGDVVLVRTDQSPAATAISLAQLFSRNMATRAGYLYTHAALYVGDGTIIDATLADGVTERSILDYCATREIAVRRVPNLGGPERLAIAAQA